MGSKQLAVNEMENEKVPPSTVDSGKRNRRGRGSKSKQTEAFRAKKNRDFDDNFIKKLEDLKITFGYTSKDLFGDRMLTPILKPQVKIPVSLASVGSLATLVAETLHHACKIPPPTEEVDDAITEFDVETLMWVTALQLEAKIFYARSGTQFPDTNLEVCDRARRTAQLLPRALLPLAVVIDQIGRFLHLDQLFVPVPNGTDDFLYAQLSDENNAARLQFRSLIHEPQEGARTTFRDHLGRFLIARANIANRDQLVSTGILTAAGDLSAEFLAAPQNFQYVGLVEFEPVRNPPAVLTFTEIVRRYAGLEGRVLKKLANVFVEVDLTKGQGVESQIVFRQVSPDGTCVAWSPRAIRADALEIGAILGLGYPCLIGSRECAAHLCTIDMSAGLENLANVLTKKLR